MKVSKLKDFTKGWVIGNFEPTLFNTDQFEIAVKHYKAGDKEEKHYHKIATETTLIVSGTVLMNGVIYNGGEIVTIESGEATDFEALTDTITTVIKIPCVKDDKFFL